LFCKNLYIQRFYDKFSFHYFLLVVVGGLNFLLDFASKIKTACLFKNDLLGTSASSSDAAPGKN
jgi:hypothetical protein